MALDSARKRFAVAGMVLPETAKPRAWRAAVAGMYPVADFAEFVATVLRGRRTRPQILNRGILPMSLYT